MPKPISPIVSADSFVVNSRDEVCLIKRADNGLWALPGGCQDLGETPAHCAVREYREETGLDVRIVALLGVFSSQLYEYVTYPYRENEFCHLLFKAELVGGTETVSEETTDVRWFPEESLPEIFDGHLPRIMFGFDSMRDPFQKPHFE